MKKYLILIIAILIYSACDESTKNDHDDHDHGDHIVSKTRLLSTSLSISQQKIQPFIRLKNGTQTAITPTNVSGEALSILFAWSDYEDDGIVIFGNGRPDIAPAGSETQEYDFANPLVISDSVGIKPDLPDGESRHMVALFSYMDFEFNTPDGSSHTVRLAFADLDSMHRGDKLYETSPDIFKYYDLNTGLFTEARPSNPSRISDIENFTDPIRPNLVFYPINIQLDSGIYFYKDSLDAATSIDADIDFVVTQSIVVDVSNNSFIADSVIKNFNLRQIAENFSETGFSASATVDLNY